MRKSLSPVLLLYLVFIGLVCGDLPYLRGEDEFPLNDAWFLKSAFLIKESGAVLSSPDFQPRDWHRVDIPSTVLSALVKAGRYPDPYIGMNNMRIPDASEEFSKQYDLDRFSHLPENRNPWKDPYWFWTRFRGFVTEGRFFHLNLKGINYRADVWLNGHLIADHKTIVGMFGSWDLDVTGLLHFTRENTLAIKVYPLDYAGLPGEPQVRAFGSFGLNGGNTGDIGKNVTMQSSVGWDWIPAVRDRNMGIWQNVSISATGPLFLRYPRILTDLPLPRINEADLTIEVTAENRAEMLLKGRLYAAVALPGAEEKILELRKEIVVPPGGIINIQLSSRDYPQLLIKEPRLWRPHDMGHPNLYDLELRLESRGKVWSRLNRRFGIREIESRVTFVDGWARRDFFINGRRILIRGGAWVPDMLLARNSDKLEAELRLSREANLNIVRIWGGGVTPPEEFFDLCDRLGLLVWHDFWITGDCQGTWGKGSKDYPLEGDVFLGNAAQTVSRLQTHPCLLLWTAGNEGYPRKELYVPLRNDILAGMDGTRPFLPSSGYSPPPEEWGLSWPDNQPAGTYSGGPYWWVDPLEYYRLVKEGKDWLFKNEVGIPSLPLWESLEQFIPDLKPDPEVAFPLNHIWGYHDACEGNGRYSLYHQAIEQRYGRAHDLADYVAKAQLLNAESYRAIFEAVNQARDRTAGVILWKTNPAWPSVVWQLYDWYLRPHAGYYYVKKACEPVHIQLDPSNYRIDVLNHTEKELSGLKVEAHVFDLQYQTIRKMSSGLSIPAESVSEVFCLELNEREKADLHFVELRLLDAEGDTVSENFYWLSSKADFSGLASLPEVRLGIQAEAEKSGANVKVSVYLENPSKNPAFFIRPQVLAGEEGEEILPSFWSDSFFCLMPERSGKVTVDYAAAAVQGKKTYLKIGGWNIKPQLIALAFPIPARKK